jgi:hypothetical protein
MDQVRNQMPAAILASLIGALLLSGCAAVQDVKVVNTPTAPVPVRDVDHRARTPFIAKEFFTLDDLSFNGGKGFTVPAGKRLVIESISVHAISRTGQTLETRIQPPIGSDFIDFYLSMTPISFGPSGLVWTGTHAVKLYADPGKQVALIINRDTPNGPAQIEWTISGYLVDVP